MQHDGDFETVEETLSSGSARIQASRRMIDDLDRRLSRGSQLLGSDESDESDTQARADPLGSAAETERTETTRRGLALCEQKGDLPHVDHRGPQRLPRAR